MKTKKANSRSISLVVAVVLLVCGIVGGTLAWLTDKTESVTNVFTTSDINIELEETKKEFQMIPGHTIDKDPVVTVEEGSEDCYLFVKIEKENNFDAFMTFVVADGWTALTGVNGVYYRTVLKTDEVRAFDVLAGNGEEGNHGVVTVKPEVTKEMMNALTDSNRPTLSFTAYACQLYEANGVEFTPAKAWDNLD